MNSQKQLFSLPNSVTYLNCAYMSPQLKTAESIGKMCISLKSNPFKTTPKDFFTVGKGSREEFAQLIGSSDADNCFFIPSASYGFATLSKNVALKKDDEILVTAEQFPSNYYSWTNVARSSGARIIAVEPEKAVTTRSKDWSEKILETINERTKIVSIGTVHWADGSSFDLIAIAKKAKSVGAYFFLDGTQSIGAMPFDVKEVDPDALICAGYKWLFGPYMTGMAYFSPRIQHWSPLEENWRNRKGSEDFSRLVNYETEYQPKALRFEVGESANFVLLPLLAHGLKQLNDWKPSAIQDYCCEISKEAKNDLLNAGFRLDETSESHHLFGIRVPEEASITDIQKRLKEEQVFVSVRGKAIRISPHVYNDEEDFQKLSELLIGSVR